MEQVVFGQDRLEGDRPGLDDVAGMYTDRAGVTSWRDPPTTGVRVYDVPEPEMTRIHSAPSTPRSTTPRPQKRCFPDALASNAQAFDVIFGRGRQQPGTAMPEPDIESVRAFQTEAAGLPLRSIQTETKRSGLRTAAAGAYDSMVSPVAGPRSRHWTHQMDDMKEIRWDPQKYAGRPAWTGEYAGFLPCTPLGKRGARDQAHFGHSKVRDLILGVGTETPRNSNFGTSSVGQLLQGYCDEGQAY